jgi:hypothetical protein
MNEPKRLSEQKHRELLARLCSLDELVRIQAAVRLTGSGVETALVRPGLEAALASSDADERRLAAWVLARLPGRAAA